MVNIFDREFINVYIGTSGNDTLTGGQYDDYIEGGNGNDTLYGGTGDDVIIGDSFIHDSLIYGHDTIYGGIGNDIIVGGRGNDLLYGEDDDDTFINYNIGSAKYDGGDGNDTILLFNYNGSDISNPTPVKLRVDGIVGVESIINATFNTATIELTGPGTYHFDGALAIDFESVEGSYGDDVIFAPTFGSISSSVVVGGTVNGGGGNDVLYGSALSDTLNGGSGSDVLRGGAGNDILTGGTGADYFAFNINEGLDLVKDYVDGVDKIALGPTIWSINLYYYDYDGDSIAESTLLAFGDGATYSTYAILQNVLPTVIDGSDLVWV